MNGGRPPIPWQLKLVVAIAGAGLVFELARPLLFPVPAPGERATPQRGMDDHCELSPMVPVGEVPATRATARVEAIRLRLPGWWEVLPDCPCGVGEIPRGWSGGAASPRYHPGAASCFRSPPASREDLIAAGIDPVAISPGQQCCYDGAGRLIPSGPAAGTPDLFSPVDRCSALAHERVDVELFEQLGWEEYVKHWPPNPGRGCNR
ncbi:MAG: hypothetical protein JRI55_24895 [Deltaproteobacteria bacterium]|jgi:hypothetical protein|nr:hypothetical protein [Deltaproteobacteria bacterium]